MVTILPICFVLFLLLCSVSLSAFQFKCNGKSSKQNVFSSSGNFVLAQIAIGLEARRGRQLQTRMHWWLITTTARENMLHRVETLCECLWLREENTIMLSSKTGMRGVNVHETKQSWWLLVHKVGTPCVLSRQEAWEIAMTAWGF